MQPITYRIPMRTRFRGITDRQGMVWRGSAGWGGVEPVPRLRRGRAGARGCGRRTRRPSRAGRSRSGIGSPVNATVPAVGPEQAAAVAAGSGLPDGQGQGRRARADAGRRPGPGRGGPRGARPGRPGPGRRQRRLVGRRRPRRRCAALTEFDLEYAEQPCRTVEELAELRRRLARRDRRPDRRRRVDPPGRGPVPGRSELAGGRHRGAQGAAARRGPGLPGDRGADRAAGGGVQRPGDLDRDPGRAGAGRGPARAAVRLRAEHRPAAAGRSGRPPADRRGRLDRRDRPRTSTRNALDRLAADAEEQRFWQARLMQTRCR